MIESVFKYITGIVKLRGATDNTQIGNSADSLKVITTSSALPTGASTLAEQQTQTTRLTSIRDAVEIIDDWDESDRAKVNPIVGQAGVQGNTGVVTANTQRVVLATDVALPAGTNTIGGVTLPNGSLTDRSGSATGASAQIAAANSSRRYFFIQCHAGTIWLNFGVAAVASQPSIRLNNGDTFLMEGSFVSTQTINVISGGGTRDFTAKEG